MNIHKLNQKDQVIKSLCDEIELNASNAIEKRNTFLVGLSGGSLIDLLCQGLPSIKTDWSKWVFFFCDERLVSFDDSESTYGCYKKKLIGAVPINDDQFVKIDPSLSCELAAVDYEQKIKKHFPVDVTLPEFDLLLLGAGPDGHICSLFPGHALLHEINKWVAPITDSPKPPPCRVTLTFPVINNSLCAMFAAIGAGKAPIVKEILQGNQLPPLPASQVKLNKGSVHWFLDKEAAGLLD